MSQNQFYRSSDSQTSMPHSFIPTLIYGLNPTQTGLFAHYITGGGGGVL